MRAVVQRVDTASVVIDKEEKRTTGQGLLVFLGVMNTDTKEQADYLAKKICDLRIFTDENDKLNLSLDDISGDVMLISNFTLSADCRKGRRPSFDRAKKGEEAKSLYEYFKSLLLAKLGENRVKSGEFGAHMDINAQNNGPITLILDTDNIVK